MSPARYTELINAFSRQDIIVICWHPECLCHRLKGWSEGEWAVYPRQKAYGNYSHGICELHFDQYAQEALAIARETALEPRKKVAAWAD